MIGSHRQNILAPDWLRQSVLAPDWLRQCPGSWLAMRWCCEDFGCSGQNQLSKSFIKSPSMHRGEEINLGDVKVRDGVGIMATVAWDTVTSCWRWQQFPLKKWCSTSIQPVVTHGTATNNNMNYFRYKSVFTLRFKGLFVIFKPESRKLNFI